MPSETSEYTVRYPIKVVGDEIPKDERPQALPGQRQRTHENKVVSSGTVTLSDEDAAPLLEAGAIVPAGADPSLSHDPEVVGYEGANTGADGFGAASGGAEAGGGVFSADTAETGGTSAAAGTSNSATGADASLVEALGEDVASTLAGAGITSLAQAKAATNKDLDAIDGVGKKAIEKIRAAGEAGSSPGNGA